METNDRIDSLQDEGNTTGQKKPYHTPKLHHYGGLAELVQNNPHRGADGEVRWVDCTSG
ncbi:MAG TPA: hypothetical protein VIM89_01945 [Mucilaginibacter sp.]